MHSVEEAFAFLTHFNASAQDVHVGFSTKSTLLHDAIVKLTAQNQKEETSPDSRFSLTQQNPMAKTGDLQFIEDPPPPSS